MITFLAMWLRGISAAARTTLESLPTSGRNPRSAVWLFTTLAQARVSRTCCLPGPSRDTIGGFRPSVFGFLVLAHSRSNSLDLCVRKGQKRPNPRHAPLSDPCLEPAVQL